MPGPRERDVEAEEPEIQIQIDAGTDDRVERNAENQTTSPCSPRTSEATEHAATTTSSIERPAPVFRLAGGGCFGGDHSDDATEALGTGKPILIEFRDFVLGGNLIRMAVAFILALSLNNLVSQFVASFITPVLGIIGATDFQNLNFSVRGSVFAYGNFIDAAISFLVLCSVLFFFLILPVQRYGGRCVPSWIIRKCPYCCTDMPAIATKCANCTSDIVPLVKPLKPHTPEKKKTFRK